MRPHDRKKRLKRHQSKHQNNDEMTPTKINENTRPRITDDLTVPDTGNKR